MQPEVPAALARTGLVVVACWVLNAPVLLAIRVLGTCGPCCVRGAAQTARCPLVSRPPALTAACLPLAGAGASHLVSARSRSVPNPRSAPSRPVSLSRIRSMSVQLCSCRILLRVPCCPCGVSCCPLHPGGCCRGPLVVRPPIVSDHCFELRIRLASLLDLICSIYHLSIHLKSQFCCSYYRMLRIALLALFCLSLHTYLHSSLHTPRHYTL